MFENLFVWLREGCGLCVCMCVCGGVGRWGGGGGERFVFWFILDVTALKNLFSVGSWTISFGGGSQQNFSQHPECPAETSGNIICFQYF